MCQCASASMLELWQPSHRSVELQFDARYRDLAERPEHVHAVSCPVCPVLAWDSLESCVFSFPKLSVQHRASP